LTDAVFPALKPFERGFAKYDFIRRENAMNIHDKAPDFTLQNEDGKNVSLKDLRGKTVVLYFFPRADTPG
jgi:peroxiredoxin